jgi:hypothetical protein
MNKILLSLALVFASLFITASATVTEEEGVLVLNETNFDEVLVSHDYIVVDFYATWW